ncbi:MAG: 1-acyl-sn-glycerol-3-phosphate acyltransferase, partial [Bryobacteraceae bacterium]
PPYKRVHSFEIRIEPLPRTTTRKLQRFQVLRELSEKKTAAAVEEPAPEPVEPAARVIYDLIRRLKDVPAVRGSMNLELDLGFASLERAELVFSIQETFHVRIPDAEMTTIFTVDDLVAAVLQKVSGELPVNGQARASWHALLREPLGEEEERILKERLVPSPAAEVFYFVLSRIARFFFWAFLRFRVRGLERLPKEYPYLICVNHLSFIDAFLVISTVPFRVLRRMCFLGDTDHFAGGFKTLVGRMGKVILVHPDRGPQVALRLAAEGLQRGLVLCVFPEGERSIDGKLKEFRPGPSILAAEFGVPIVPAAIRGAYEVWPRGSSRIHLHPVSLEYGNPMPPPAPGTPYEAVTRRLHEEIRSLAE